MRDKYPRTFQLADDLLVFAYEFPWQQPAQGEDDVERLWRYWTPAFVVAGYRLFRSEKILLESGLFYESQLPLRSLLELAGTMHYIANDVGRITEFVKRGAKDRARMADAALRLGHATPEMLKDFRSKAQKDLARLKGLDYGEPFAQEARLVLPEAGLEEHYLSIYKPANNWVHMNAAALDSYQTEEDSSVYLNFGPDEFGGETLRQSMRLLLGILWRVSEALEQRQDEALQGFVDRLKSLEDG